MQDWEKIQSQAILKETVFAPNIPYSKLLHKAAELFLQEAMRLDELGKHSQVPELLAHFSQDNQTMTNSESPPGT